MVDIIMPQLGETVTEGTVTRWTKAVGDAVAEDEVLFEVSTDKVDSEVRSPASGFLTEILVPEGETVDVGVKLAVVGDRAGSPGEVAKGNGAGKGQVGPWAPGTAEPAPPTGTAEPAPPTGSAEPAPPTGSAEPAPPSPVGARSNQETPAKRAQADPWDTGELDGGSPGQGDPRGRRAGGRVLSPVVRRLLSEHGLDPEEVPGSGADGRITRADVLAAVDNYRASQTSAPPAQPAPAQPAPAQPAPAQYSPPPFPDRATEPSGTTLARTGPGAMPALAPGARDEVVPFSNIRRRTAEHMVRSQATSAHTLVAMEVDFEAVEAARRAHKAAFMAEEGVKLTYLPFIARALADAIAAFPHLNASVGDDCLIVHRDLHLGIAVDLGQEGLIVPVIHEAGDKRLRALAREAAELATRARSRKLTANDISGGTFTITNPGPFGTFITAPIINQPQVAILSTDGVRRRPVVVSMPDGSEGIAIHSTGVLALSFDHRALDGAYASRFLDRMRSFLQGRDWSLEL